MNHVFPLFRTVHEAECKLLTRAILGRGFYRVWPSLPVPWHHRLHFPPHRNPVPSFLHALASTQCFLAPEAPFPWKASLRLCLLHTHSSDGSLSTMSSERPSQSPDLNGITGSWECRSVVECLPIIRKALGSIFGTV